MVTITAKNYRPYYFLVKQVYTGVKDTPASVADYLQRMQTNIPNQYAIIVARVLNSEGIGAVKPNTQNPTSTLTNGIE